MRTWGYDPKLVMLIIEPQHLQEGRTCDGCCAGGWWAVSADNALIWHVAADSEANSALWCVLPDEYLRQSWLHLREWLGDGPVVIRRPAQVGCSVRVVRIT